MMFSWSKEEKEIYRAEAEKRIAEAGLEETVLVDREQFRINVKDKTAKIEIKKISTASKANMDLWKKVKTISGFEADKPMMKNEHGKLAKRRFYSGRIIVNLV